MADNLVFWVKSNRVWKERFQQIDVYENPVPFAPNSVLITQLKVDAVSDPILTLTSTITDFSLGTWTIEMTKEQSKLLPTPIGNDVARVLYMETSVVTDVITVWPLVYAAVVYAVVGETPVDSNAYVNLITSEHRNRPKFISWMSKILKFAEDTSNCAVDLISAFTLDQFASGVQLDVIGQLVGVGRSLSFIPSDGRGTELSDADYRKVIKAKIIKNNWKGQINELVSLWEVLFPEILIVIADNQDMTMTVYLAGGIDTFFQELVANGYIVPKPAAVGINYSYGMLPVFGYDIENDGYIAGYDVGYWADLR